MQSKECHVVDDRLRFVARLLDGEKMAPLYKEFGISRKTGYKIFARYKTPGNGNTRTGARRRFARVCAARAPTCSAPR